MSTSTLTLKDVHVPTREDLQKAISLELAKLETAHSQKQVKELLGANWFKCTACKAGLNAVMAGVIAAAIVGFPEDVAIIAPIAAACGVSVAVVTTIISGLSGGGVAAVEECISGLCQAMKAC